MHQPLIIGKAFWRLYQIDHAGHCLIDLFISTYLPLIKSARGDNCKRNDAIVRIGEGLWVIDTVIIVYLDVVEKRLKRRGGSVSQSSLS
eukprot:scaffold1037_cov144-Skeletonema_menzelii.AAC.2